MTRSGLSLGFIENRGQFADPVRFVLRSRGMTAFVTTEGFAWTLREPADPPRLLPGHGSPFTTRSRAARRVALRMTFEDTSPGVAAEGDGRRETYVNDFLGDDPSRWASRVPTWNSARLVGLYPGVDAVVREADGSPVYDLVVSPGADPARIRFRIEGGDRCRVDSRGDLVIDTPLGTLRQTAPVAMVRGMDGGTRGVPCRFRQLGPERFGFDVAPPAAGEALVIDPTLMFQPLYFNYLGGTGHDVALDVALTTHGRATITGATINHATDFPSTPGAFQPEHADDPPGAQPGLENYDVFVTQLRADGTALSWATFIGGTTGSTDPIAVECGYGVAVDAAGAVYVCGVTFTDSGDFPTTPGSFSENAPGGGGGADGFVLKLGSEGDALVYSTYLGGSEEDQCQDIAVDALGQAYVCGTSRSNGVALGLIPFPTTSGVVQPTPGGPNLGSEGGFVTKLSADGSQLLYSTWVRAQEPAGEPTPAPTSASP